MVVQSLIVYSGNHAGEFPAEESWNDALIEAGLATPEDLVSFAEDGDGLSYIFVPGSFSFDSTQILVYEDPKHYQEGVLVGFADAHIKMIDHETFEQMLAEQLAAQNESP